MKANASDRTAPNKNFETVYTARVDSVKMKQRTVSKDFECKHKKRDELAGRLVPVRLLTRLMRFVLEGLKKL